MPEMNWMLILTMIALCTVIRIRLITAVLTLFRFSAHLQPGMPKSGPIELKAHLWYLDFNPFTAAQRCCVVGCCNPVCDQPVGIHGPMTKCRFRSAVSVLVFVLVWVDPKFRFSFPVSDLEGAEPTNQTLKLKVLPLAWSVSRCDSWTLFVCLLFCFFLFSVAS